MRWVNHYTDLLDTKYRVPGTRIRFGADFLLGLIPGAGDALSLVMSGLLIATMAKNGASLRLVLKMLGNVIVDTFVGSVPVAGNAFDLFFRANSRNLKLMQEHYEQGKHRERAWPILMSLGLLILTVFAGLFALLAYAVNRLFGIAGELFWGP